MESRRPVARNKLDLDSVETEFSGNDVYEQKHRKWQGQKRAFSICFGFAFIALLILIFAPRRSDKLAINSQVKSIEAIKAVSKAINVEDETKNELLSKTDLLIESIREFKKKGKIIEKDTEAQLKVLELQTSLRKLIPILYGPEPYIVEMTLKFPASMLGADGGFDGKLTFELAPLALVPYSVYYFLDTIKNWKVDILFNVWLNSMLTYFYISHVL